MYLDITTGRPDLRLAAIRRTGVDLTDEGIDVPAGARIDGIEIHLTDQRQEIAGVVRDAAGRAASDTPVLFFPQDQHLWTGTTRYQGVVRTNAEGRYRVSPPPPGNYFIVAVDRMDPSRQGDPGLYATLSRWATPVTLVEGATVNLDLHAQRLPQPARSRSSVPGSPASLERAFLLLCSLK